MMTFGQCADQLDVNISPDKRALTLTFPGAGALEVGVGGGKLAAPVSTRTFTFVVLLEGADKKKSAEIEFLVQGQIVTTKGATATVVSSVNGQTKVANYRENSDESFVQKLKFVAKMPSECRLCVFLQVGRDSINADSEAYLNVSTIDAEILPRPSTRRR